MLPTLKAPGREHSKQICAFDFKYPALLHGPEKGAYGRFPAWSPANFANDLWIGSDRLHICTRSLVNQQPIIKDVIATIACLTHAI